MKVERLKPSSSEVITVMRKAIKETVIDKGYCPPLSKLVNQFVDPDGEINWGDPELRKQVVFEVQHPKRTPAETVTGVVDKLTALYKSISEGDGPLSYMLIFPPPPSDNSSFDQIIIRVKLELIKKFIYARNKSTEDKIIRGIIRNAKANSRFDPALFDSLLKLWQSSSEEDRFNVLKTVIEYLFNLVYFYGHPIEGEVLLEMKSDRGPVSRQQVLSRLPFNAVQIVNQAHPDVVDLTGKINKAALYIINSKKAGATNQDLLEEYMNELRRKALGEG